MSNQNKKIGFYSILSVVLILAVIGVFYIDKVLGLSCTLLVIILALMTVFTKKKSKIIREKSEKIVLGIAFPILILWSLTFIYCFIWILMNSFKTNIDFTNDPNALPTIFHFNNWVKAFKATEVPLLSNPYLKANMEIMILNSLWWMFGTVLISNCVVIMAAYTIAKYNKYLICRFLFTLNLIIMAIPIVGALPSQMKLYDALGIRNNPLMLLTAAGAIGGSSLMIYYSFFKNISWSYAEAVFIDGGGHLTVFLRIMVPQALPIISAMVVIGCIGSWADYMTPYLFLQNNPTLATGLHLFYARSGNEPTPIYFAAVLWSALPMFILFAIFSDKIMTSVNLGGLKG